MQYGSCRVPLYLRGASISFPRPLWQLCFLTPLCLLTRFQSYAHLFNQALNPSSALWALLGRGMLSNRSPCSLSSQSSQWLNPWRWCEPMGEEPSQVVLTPVEFWAMGSGEEWLKKRPEHPDLTEWGQENNPICSFFTLGTQRSNNYGCLWVGLCCAP